jgi:choline-sulfatase
VDDKVGQLIQAMERTGLAENTIILFTSDHGEMLGERGLWYKMSFFEWSARVPLLVHAPQQFKPRRVAEHVSLLDLLPTLVELASGQEQPPLAAPVDGHSLVPLLQGEESGRRDGELVVGEILCEGAVAPCFMVRSGTFKYIYSPADPEQLYDLEADPRELQNLAAVPAYQATRRSFYDVVMNRWDVQDIHRRVLASQRRRHLVSGAGRIGTPASWDYQPVRDAAQQYMRNHLQLDDLERSARFPPPDSVPPDGPGGAKAQRQSW